MAIYSEYLDKLKSAQDIHSARQAQLTRIASLRGHAVLTIASDMSPRPERTNAPTGIDYTDLLPVADQLEHLDGAALDVVLETPGGYAENAEDIVRMIRAKFASVSFIIPGAAKSAGTIMVMSADEILMDDNSSLGPIDAQVSFGRAGRHSAEAFLEGLRKIKVEADETGQLNKAYIPILTDISPGTIQACENAQQFSQKLVRNWLATYKFSSWDTHSSTGEPVTRRQKWARAAQIARKLCNHSHWLTHGRSIKLADLQDMGLQVTNYSLSVDLADAIQRYYALVRMTFESTGIYKIFETPTHGVYRTLAPVAPVPTAVDPTRAELVHVDFECPRCSNKTKIQANLGQARVIEPGSVPFPPDNRFQCPRCGLEADLGDLRKQIEAQSKKPVV